MYNFRNCNYYRKNINCNKKNKRLLLNSSKMSNQTVKTAILRFFKLIQLSHLQPLMYNTKRKKVMHGYGF